MCAAPVALDRRSLLEELPWPEVAAALRRDPRLMVPVGTCLQHGPHLPLATDAIIVERIASELSERHGTLAAPVLPYGVNSQLEQEYAGTASLQRKTLHRLLNDLVAGWEGHGVEEFVFLTAHGFGPHISAIATVVSGRARIRAVDLHSVDLSDHLEEPHRESHGGELETSLLLHLAPELVRMEAAEDLPFEDAAPGARIVGEEPVPPPGSAGVVGSPSLATAAKGETIFRHLVRFLGERILERGARSEV